LTQASRLARQPTRFARWPARRFARLRRIESLDPVADHLEIYRISTTLEFFEEYKTSLALALFRTYAVPSISGLLAATGEFRLRPQRRYDDTALLMAALVEHGYDGELGRVALKRINQMHNRYAISPDDMRYVLSTFVYEPVRWIDRFGWRKLSTNERLAGYHFYREVGRRMGIGSIPPDYAAFESFNIAYEREHFRLAPSNVEVGDATLDLLASWYPRFARRFLKRSLLAPLDRPLLDAFGYRRPGPPLRALSHTLLRATALRRRVAKPPAQPRYRDDVIRSYPDGYRVERLGAGPPPADLDPTWLAGARNVPPRRDPSNR
jgi:hypothetical protein